MHNLRLHVPYISQSTNLDLWNTAQGKKKKKKK